MDDMSTQYRSNKTKTELMAGATIKVPEINRVFDPTVVETIADIGYTCVWIDMEHSHADFRDLSALILAARASDIDVFVRVPHGPYNQIIKTLELGASGLIWPHCKSAEEARYLVEMAKFHPQGMRGMGGGRDSGFGKVSRPEYFDLANDNVLLGVMIEDFEGVDACDEIAAVDGIDLLFVGPGDLSQSYGVHRESGHPISQPKVLEAFEKVGKACRTNGKAMGTAVDPGPAMQLAIERGATWLNCCHDVNALTIGYSSAMAETDKTINLSRRS
ncbi:MAG: aldolase/citrate lyase family protein [Chloroflexi bacterium]|nr:aldolase/citrate lyase family protein [Chloroflexota bacterium]